MKRLTIKQLENMDSRAVASLTFEQKQKLIPIVKAELKKREVNRKAYDDIVKKLERTDPWILHDRLKVLTHRYKIGDYVLHDGRCCKIVKIKRAHHYDLHSSRAQSHPYAVREVNVHEASIECLFGDLLTKYKLVPITPEEVDKEGML